MVSHAPHRTDAILFEMKPCSRSRLIPVHGVFTLDHTEPHWSLRHACTNPSQGPLFHLDLDEPFLDENELMIMGSILAVPEFDHHFRTLHVALDVTGKEAAANRRGNVVEGYMYYEGVPEGFQIH